MAKNEGKGTCPDCGGELKPYRKTQYACQKCGLVLRQGKTSLPAALAPLAIKLIEDHGTEVGGGRALTADVLVGLLMEYHVRELVSLMSKPSQGDLGAQRSSLTAALNSAWRQGLLGSIPPRHRLYCAPGHPEAK